MSKVQVEVTWSQNLRKEASRLSSMANKRIQRLENAGLTQSPAYKKWLEDGGQKFGVKGKNINEVQAEVSRLKKFIDSNTSTIKGLNNTLKEMAANTGIKYSNVKELYAKAEKFFELSSKVEQYLRTVEDMASAIGYQKIWEAINQYVQVSEVDLSDSNIDLDQMTAIISDALASHDSGKAEVIPYGNDTIWSVIK